MSTDSELTIYEISVQDSNKRLGLLVVPCAYSDAGTHLLPIVENAVSKAHQVLKTHRDKTLLISLRRSITKKDINISIKNALDNELSLLLFACDTVERAESVMSKIYSIENKISLLK